MFIFASYLMMSGISLAFFYLLYKILLSNDTNYQSRRLVLLSSLVLSLLIPFVSNLIPSIESAAIPILKVRDFIEAPLSINTPIASTAIGSKIEYAEQININWNKLGYWLVVFALFFRWLIAYSSIQKLLRRATILPFKRFLLAILNEHIPPFSFSKYIILSKEDYEQNKTPILLHEEEHLRQHHTADVLFMDLICYLQWFNPFVWLLKRELKLVHEHQADLAVLNKGIDATQYQLLILKKAVGRRRFALASNFTQCSISKRIKMMKNKKQKRWGIAKAFLFIPMGFLLLQAFASPKIVTKVNELPPLIMQVDSSQIWLRQWSPANINNTISSPEMLLIEGVADDKEENYLQPHNAMQVLQNRNDDYLVQNERANKNEIEMILINFIKGKGFKNIPSPEKTEIKLSNGKTARINKGVIIFQYDRGTSKAELEFTFRTIGKAYLKVRKEKSRELFNKNYFSLNKVQRLEIDESVPIRVISPRPMLTRATVEIDNGLVSINGISCPVSKLAQRLNEYQKKNKHFKYLVIQTDEDNDPKFIKEVNDQLKLVKIKNIKYKTK